jgi:hypothetical protein
MIYTKQGIHYIAPAKIEFMSEKKPVTTTNNLFGKENYTWIIAGIIVIALGLILMAGGKSDDPNTFDPKEVYSFRRITLAPILILIGLGLEIFAIFRKPKA